MNDCGGDKNKCLINYLLSYCQCSLDENLGGDDCSKKFCVNDCSFNGVCDFQSGKCKCNDFYWGIDCSILEIELQ